MEAVLEGENVGLVIRSFSEEEMRSAVGRLLELVEDETLSDRCVKVARRLFSLGQGVEDYREIYRRLTVPA